MSGKEHDDGLDASFIISQAKSRNRPLHPYTPEKEEEASALSEPSGEAASSSATKEEGRRRRGKGQDYERLFIRNAPSNTRSGKTVYIRKEFHERITRIVQVIGKNELSLYSYLDNVLEQHFATYQEEISELYKKRNSDIFLVMNPIFLQSIKNNPSCQTKQLFYLLSWRPSFASPYPSSSACAATGAG